jgi:probable F420-dependent oxidoreductase
VNAAALGRVGIWSGGFKYGDRAAAREAAVELEALGYGTLWVPGGAHAGTLDACADLLEATERVVVATGIVNVWIEDADGVAAQASALLAAHPGRLLLGIGCSHAPLIGGRYEKPLTATRNYLDALAGARSPVSAADRVVAALGPRMLELAAARSAGTHTYLMPLEHTRLARAALGPAAIVAPEQTVVLDGDPASARATARAFMEPYFGLPNFTSKIRSAGGFADADFAGGGSDRLIDGIVAWGDEAAISERLAAHIAAGADHVCIQAVSPPDRVPMDALRRLAPPLTEA